VTQITIEEAVAHAKRELLPLKGVVGVSYANRTIIVYVETPEDARNIPSSYYGYPVIVKITGRVVPL
jgi:hypothetical protein